ncbi:hypothetical protein B296_00013938 [Ensete ventricosum]|uniref:Uncharacterized protein n=1 Tax=Ensete ventricosum TaxID=4639 RepID=A0A427AV97_ENSVE|nr:hypothetical protein B296_00013938 [Ensete ventricosum]
MTWCGQRGEEGRWGGCSGIREKVEEATTKTTRSSGGWKQRLAIGTGEDGLQPPSHGGEEEGGSGQASESRAKQRRQRGDDGDSGRGDGEDNSVGLAVGSGGRRWGGEEEGAIVMQLHGCAEEGVDGRQQWQGSSDYWLCTTEGWPAVDEEERKTIACKVAVAVRDEDRGYSLRRW